METLEQPQSVGDNPFVSVMEKADQSINYGNDVIDSIQAELGLNEGSYDPHDHTRSGADHGTMEPSTSMSAGSSKQGVSHGFGAAADARDSSGSGNKRDRSTLLESVG